MIDQMRSNSYKAGCVYTTVVPGYLRGAGGSCGLCSIMIYKWLEEAVTYLSDRATLVEKDVLSPVSTFALSLPSLLSLAPSDDYISWTFHTLSHTYTQLSINRFQSPHEQCVIRHRLCVYSHGISESHVSSPFVPTEKAKESFSSDRWIWISALRFAWI